MLPVTYLLFKQKWRQDWVLSSLNLNLSDNPFWSIFKNIVSTVLADKLLLLTKLIPGDIIVSKGFISQ